MAFSEFHPAPAPETGPISYTPSGHAGMDNWRAAFSEKALADNFLNLLES